jgi:hypothetical protein
LSPTASTVPDRGIVRYDPTLDEEILRFNLEAYPTRRRDWVEPRWRWMFLESAKRLGVEPMVWMYRTGGRIVAHQGAIPVRLRVGGQEFTTGWFVETMVLESHRGKAIGPMVVKKALEDLPFNLSLGQTQDMRTLQFALGWKQVAPLETYVYALNPLAVVAGKVPSAIKPVAAAALWGRQRIRAATSGVAGKTSEFTIRPVARFNGGHDRLWERIRDRFPCAVVRDASFLNWKYVDQPGQNFVRIEVVRDRGPVAVVVIALRSGEVGYAYRRGFLVELIVDPADRAAVHASIRAGCDVLEADGADLLVCDLISPVFAAALVDCGFSAREPERYLLVSTAGLETALAGRLQDPSTWLATGGDSDIDRPW